MDQFDAFSVFFWDNNVHIGGRSYPLGQATVDVLNLSTEDFNRLCDCAEAFDRALDRMLERRDRRMAEEVQSKFNAAYDCILTLPVFRDLELDEDARTVFTDMRDMPEAWGEAMQEDTAGGQMLRAFAARVSCLPERLNIFRGQVALMLEYFFEDLPRRDSAEYGRAYGRLKMQRSRRKKDASEYNREVAQAIRDAYARGELGEEEAIARLKAIGG